MKKGMAIVLAVLLCLLACCALADDYGKAVIDGGNGYKVHLRDEPSARSESIGLYFTGTKVTLLSEPDEEWVWVRIGRESGYVRGCYIKCGEKADHVTPRFWQGTVNATRYARMRYGPSTEYQFLRNVSDGERVTIMGETEENWYYVEYKGNKGFISANLIRTSGKVFDDQGIADLPDAMPEPVLNWRQAYREYLQANASSRDTFGLIYVNEDEVPELVIDSGIEAQGCRILTYADGQVNVLTTRRLGFTYIERGNRLCNSDGNMDSYYDDVYEIRNGRWLCIARGEYYGYLSGWNDILGRYVCKNYFWNGRKTDIGQYMISLSSVYDGQRAQGMEEGYSYSGILRQL